MKIEQVREIANAVLYEGYLLYPYRHSAIKNRQRWNFGVVYPHEYSEANGNIEPWTMQTECLITGSADTSLDIYVRFLHLLVRSVTPSEPTNTPSQDNTNTSTWSLAANLANEPLEEGIEREVSALNLSLDNLVAHPHRVEIAFPGDRIVEHDTINSKEIIREQQPLMGAVIISAEAAGPELFKLSIRIENTTPQTGTVTTRHEAVLRHSFVSTHTILQVRQGAFISLMDPPEELKSLAQACQNLHTWPVMVGKEGDHDIMLSSPIILYDYPQIAPESPGALFDGTEIDEILTLRIMTLSDEEKEEIRRGDPRAREILERTESLTPEQFMKLHGVIRNLQAIKEGKETNDVGAQFMAPEVPVGAGEDVVGRRRPLGRPPGGSPANPPFPSYGDFSGEDYPPPPSVYIAGKEVKAGDHVRLRPGRARKGTHSDPFDLLLNGKTARVEAIQQDFENHIYLVVTVDDDPGRDQWDERVLPGHRFFFLQEEVEPLEDTENRDDIAWREA